MTDTLMTYVAAELADELGVMVCASGELAEVRWVSPAGAEALMGEMSGDVCKRGLPRRYFGPVVPGLDLAATWGFTRPDVVLPGAISATDLAG